jgi:DNA-directed RNA polymerase subunit RPC12/RpoP
MTRPTVRCRCGHRVLAKEVLRTDLYERPSGREYVYVKYRCKRCKRLGETFVAESRWDWRIFEASRSELSEAESESFASQSPISEDEVLAFHQQLEAIEQTWDLAGGKPVEEDSPASPDSDNPRAESAHSENERAEGPRPDLGRPEVKRDYKNEVKNDIKNEHKTRPRETGAGDEGPGRNRPPRDN